MRFTLFLGCLQEEEEEESEEEEISGDEAEEENDGSVSVADSGATSTISGIETPDQLELRKAQESGNTTPAEPKALYQVIGQVDAGSARGQFMASSHTYDLSGTSAAEQDDPMGLQRAKVDARDKLGLAAKGNQAVDIALNPEELEGLDEAQLKAKYAQASNAMKQSNKGEDYSDLIEENEKKRKIQADAREKAAKKARGDDFKF